MKPAAGAGSPEGSVTSPEAREVDERAGAAAGGDFEGLGLAGEGFVQGGAGGFDGGLEAVPDRVDLGVVGDDCST